MLFTIQELAQAMGNKSFASDDNAKAAHLISKVSSYMETVTGCYFEPHVGTVVRIKADDTGCATLEQWYPVTDISNFHDFKTDLDVTYPRWDGILELYNMWPKQVLDVTINYGFDEVPEDIKRVSIDAVIRGMKTDGTNLKSKQVGDVIYEYGDMFSFPDADQQVIDSYSAEDNRTILLGTQRGEPYTASELLLQMLPWANGPDWPPDIWFV